MKIKRVIASVIAAALCCNMIAGTASAHTGDVIGGGYIGRTEANFVLRINSSAQTNFFDYTKVYNEATKWNNISSKVHLSVVTAGGGMPTIANELHVNGVKIIDPNGDLTLGQAVPYDRNNRRIPDGGNVNVDWSYSNIEMNISDAAKAHYEKRGDFGALFDATKVFRHEVGHVLKLSHPRCSSSYDGHTYDGYPMALMNDGSLNDKPCSSFSITDHDKSCLIAKWGK